jgi:DNA invertase Pin-like site-specific DNA recombinase
MIYRLHKASRCLLQYNLDRTSKSTDLCKFINLLPNKGYRSVTLNEDVYRLNAMLIFDGKILLPNGFYMMATEKMSNQICRVVGD